jgi:hypothetical protein
MAKHKGHGKGEKLVEAAHTYMSILKNVFSPTANA